MNSNCNNSSEYNQVYSDYQHIKFLNNLDLTSKNLYKYMDVERVIELIKTGVMHYVEPSEWFDPFESLFYNADYSNLNFRKPKVFCSCLITKSTNEASWIMYSYFKQGIASRCIKLKLNPIVYFDLLESFGRSSGCQIYIGEADYSLTERTIKALHKKTTKKHKDFFNAFDTNKFINLLRVKRKAFEYEKEIRVFIVPKSRDVSSQYFDYNQYLSRISIKNDMKLIKSLVKDLTLSPICTDLEATMISSEINKCGLEIKCVKSNLYTPISQIKIEI